MDTLFVREGRRSRRPQGAITASGASNKTLMRRQTETLERSRTRIVVGKIHNRKVFKITRKHPQSRVRRWEQIWTVVAWRLRLTRTPRAADSTPPVAADQKVG